MDCGEAVRLIAAAVEKGIDPRRQPLLSEHLASCGGCRHEAETQWLVSRALAERPGEELPADAGAKLKAALDASQLPNPKAPTRKP